MIEPGVLCMPFVLTTWMESIMRKSGFSASVVARIVSRLDSLAIWMFFEVVARRFARSWIWYSDSSPEIRRVFLPCSAAAWAIWRVKVDFPMPGSPVRRVKLALRKPPLRTLSSSSMLVLRRRCESRLNWRIGVVLEGFCLIRPGLRDCLSMICSSRLFHSWHCGHWPAQEGLCALHLRQMYVFFMMC